MRWKGEHYEAGSGGPVTNNPRCSAIQRQVANCWNSALSSRRGVR